MKEEKIFKTVESVSKKARLVETLKNAILAGRLVSGESLVEGRVARELGVGLGVLREALIELAHQGFVQRTPYSGTRVTTLTDDDARHIYDLRIALEPLAFDRAAPNISGQPLTELKKIAERCQTAYRDQDLVREFQHQLAFRQLVWALSGNDYLVRVLEHVVPPLFALYLIRSSLSSANREGLLRTVAVGLEAQAQTIEALEREDRTEVRRLVEAFLVRMRAEIGQELLPEAG